MKFELVKKLDFNRKIGNVIKIVSNSINDFEKELESTNKLIEQRGLYIDYEGHIYYVNIEVHLASKGAPLDYALKE